METYKNIVLVIIEMSQLAISTRQLSLGLFGLFSIIVMICLHLFIQASWPDFFYGQEQSFWK
jgi:hypothetical protein